jgi:predicted TIM-barrel fold metal-dependent hydrolase
MSAPHDRQSKPALRSSVTATISEVCCIKSEQREMQFLDIYSHILPERYFGGLRAKFENSPAFTRWLNLPVLYDLPRRLELMNEFQGYQQVLSLSSPPIEVIAGPDESPMLARAANDALAEIVDQYPERFPAFVASLPMNSPDAAVEEATRAVRQLRACGVQVFTNVNGAPLDDPRYFPIFAKAHELDVPIWMHPARGMDHPDYSSERESKFEIWWALGWPYETSAAMSRLVFSGILDMLPGLRIITHHMGAMIPYLEGRIEVGWADQLGSRTPGVSELARLARPIPEYFRSFYADTALGGSVSGITCGLNFFGADRSLFGTDFPFDAEGGRILVARTMAAIGELPVSEREREMIAIGNARKLLGLDRPQSASAAMAT